MNTRLYRSRDDRMLAGVAGGLADLWDADPSLVRIIWALLVPLTGGIALVVYIVMAIVVPEEDEVRPWGSQATGWDARTAAPTAGPTEAAPPSASTAPTGAAPFAETPPAEAAAPAGMGAAPPPLPGAPAPAAWQPTRYEAREMRRAARSEARAARRAGRGGEGRTGAVVIGVLFILVGAWYLVRQYLPTVDWDWFWPLALVALGVVVLFYAVRPRSDDGGSAGSGGSGGS